MGLASNKHALNRTSFYVALTLTALIPAAAIAQVAPRLQLDFLNRLSSQAKETVDVTIDPAMMQQALGLLGGDKVRDDPSIKSMLSGIQGIYVKVFEFEKDGGTSQASVSIDAFEEDAQYTAVVLQLRLAR